MAPLAHFDPGDGRAHTGTEPGRMYQVSQRTARRSRAHQARWGYAADMPLIAGSLGRFLLLATVVGGLSGVLGACSGDTPASFDPTGPCTVDGASPGAYPELEALLPQTYRGEPPALVDSGRNCSAEALGTLADRFDSVRFAGATWTFGAERAVVLVVFTAPGLDAQAMADFYAASARTAPRTEILAQSDPSVAGRPGRRLDTRRVERLHTVVIWPSAQEDHVNVVLTSDLPEPRIQEAIEAFGDD